MQGLQAQLPTVIESVVAEAVRVIVQGVTRRFGAVWVLRGVDAEFVAGSVTVVGGANGAGKSTLLGIIAGLVQPTGGEVFWLPARVSVRERRASVGWVGHESLSYRDLTAAENVMLAARAHGGSSESARVSLGRVGALAFAERRVGTLSRGQKQRVALARGIVNRPDLLLFDEPSTGLDAAGSSLLESVIVEERERGAIVVVVSHDSGLASRLSARYVLVERGRVREG